MIRNRTESDSNAPSGVVSRVRQFIGMLVGHMMVSKGNVLADISLPGKAFTKNVDGTVTVLDTAYVV